MKKRLLSRIEANPKIMFGKPVVKGTRLPVEIILEKPAYGKTEDEILNEYPFLKLESFAKTQATGQLIRDNPGNLPAFILEFPAYHQSFND
jgi:uncharacterized protein (DUF433 family)